MSRHGLGSKSERHRSRVKGTAGKLNSLVLIPSTFRQKMPYNVVSPSRWSSAEFKFYYVVAFFVIPVMIWIPMSLSLSEISFLCLKARGNSIQAHSFTSKLQSLLPKSCRKAGFTTNLWYVIPSSTFCIAQGLSG